MRELFVSVCQSCDTLSTGPGCSPSLAHNLLGLAPVPPATLKRISVIFDNGWMDNK